HRHDRQGADPCGSDRHAPVAAGRVPARYQPGCRRQPLNQSYIDTIVMTQSLTYRPDQWLQSAASLAMSALLARLDLSQGGRPFFWVDFRHEPPQPSHSHWDY